MSVKPADFLDCAREQADGPHEIHKRNCISRSYYAAYHQCLDAFPYSFPYGASMHKSYIEHLLQCEVGSPNRKAGVILQALHTRRILADYHLDRPISKSAPAMQLDGTTRIFDIVAEVGANSAEA